MNGNPDDKLMQDAAEAVITGKVTYANMLTCARSELGKRQHVYPRFIKERRMKAEDADRELLRMAAIILVLEPLAHQEAAAKAEAKAKAEPKLL
jgi:hypothetical protein